MVQKKICLIGAFAVGKTSLVRQYISGQFSEKYLTTLGVKIDKKNLTIRGQEVKLMIWDLAGEDAFMKVRMSYLQGSSGLIYVIDGTRRDTMSTVIDLKEKVTNQIGYIPSVILLNKSDIQNEWQIEEEDEEEFTKKGLSIHKTSAKNADNIHKAFLDLTQKILENDS